ncbi:MULTISPECIES: iron-sulfur cluster assembly accessory protein [unclassified Thioalkalivibrio]|uniref:HesB/IscA family protein n=1 Tax=unclassified Thioalkalivibrio TaxID=2621013 RepID=UPI000366DD45|nr:MULTISPECIES: iron-sulfur cluster assembly accessory protein [unclassified Thioalkalivibrio]PYG04517.1 iron-sulfur cluster assembly protein [Thioalkalivibrio sp. ALE21]
MNSNIADATAETARIPESDRIRATDDAVRHILAQMESDPEAVGFRVEVKRTGCSGWMYSVDLVREPRPDDLVFRVDERLDVHVDPKSFEFIRGTEIDFQAEGLTRQIVFHNPNVTAECGCGESFSVDTAAS